MAEAVALTKALGLWSKEIAPQMEMSAAQNKAERNAEMEAAQRQEQRMHARKRRRHGAEADERYSEHSEEERNPLKLQYALPSQPFHLHCMLGYESDVTLSEEEEPPSRLSPGICILSGPMRPPHIQPIVLRRQDHGQ